MSNEVVYLRCRALCYLADECGEDVTIANREVSQTNVKFSLISSSPSDRVSILGKGSSFSFRGRCNSRTVKIKGCLT